MSKLINKICSRHDIAEILLKLVIKTKQNYKNDSFIMKASFKISAPCQNHRHRSVTNLIMLYRVHLDQRESRMYKHSHDRYWFHRQHIIPHYHTSEPTTTSNYLHDNTIYIKYLQNKTIWWKKTVHKNRNLIQGVNVCHNWTPFCDAWR